MKLKYGKQEIEFEIGEHHLLGELRLPPRQHTNLGEVFKHGIFNPIGKPRLVDVLRKNKPHDIVIIVSDISRSIAHYEEILRFLIAEIVDAGVDEKNIEFVVALGTHRQHTENEQRSLYGDLISHFRFSFHDCRNNCVSIGRTSSGLEVEINKRIHDAEFVIATGKINFHYMAGFSGGRKSLLPGVSSYDTIRRNHCKLRRTGVGLGELHDNIIAREMDEAAQRFALDYLVNVVETPEKETEHIVSGDPVHAFEHGVTMFTSERRVPIFQKADCALISVGGHPYDRTFYESHKAINNAVRAIKDNGSVILVAQCGEGIGNEKFFDYLTTHSLDELLQMPEERIELGGHRAFVTAQLLKKHRVYVLSDLEPRVVSQMHCIPITRIEDALAHSTRDYGVACSIYVIPESRALLPCVHGKATAYVSNTVHHVHEEASRQ